jgi:serine acetyltransferase
VQLRRLCEVPDNDREPRVHRERLLLIAPVRIGDGAYVAASSAITDNVPADALGIARGKQVNKPGWASKKRRELAAGESGKKPSKQSRKKARSRR